jgi:hypothetical protein
MNRRYRMLVVHHSADMDGLMSGAIAKKALEIVSKELDFDAEHVGYNYGTDPKQDKWLDIIAEPYDHYQFIDVTPPLDWIEKTFSMKGQTLRLDNGPWHPVVEVFDHHPFVYKGWQQLIGDMTEAMKDTEDWPSDHVKWWFCSDESGAKIYHNSLYEMRFWIDPLIDRLNMDGNVIGRIRNLLPKRKMRSAIREGLDRWLTQKYFQPIVDMVSRFDTWGWYAEWSAIPAAQRDESWAQRSMDPLAFNEWFYGLERSDFNMQFVYDCFFGRNAGNWKDIKWKSHEAVLGAWEPNWVDKTNVGWRYLRDKQKAARNKDYTMVILPGVGPKGNPVHCVTCQGQADHYNSQFIRELKTDTDRMASMHLHDWMPASEVLMSYKIDFIKRVVKLSFRDIGGNINCAELASNVGLDNGGGHEGSAGCRIGLDRFMLLFNNNNRP